MNNTASDEQAERLRVLVADTLSGIRSGAEFFRGGLTMYRCEEGPPAAKIVTDDGAEFTVNVLPAGELERLREDRRIYAVALASMARQSALIEEMRGLLGRGKQCDDELCDDSAHERTRQLRVALADYDRETKGGGY